MEKKLLHAKALERGEHAYSVESKDIVCTKVEKRYGISYKSPGKYTFVPFKKSDRNKPKPYEINGDKEGTLRLSAGRKKVTLRISLDRDVDSPEAFINKANELLDGYVLKLLKFEETQCLG